MIYNYVTEKWEDPFDDVLPEFLKEEERCAVSAPDESAREPAISRFGMVQDGHEIRMDRLAQLLGHPIEFSCQKK
jgi:hypothetical protein